MRVARQELSGPQSSCACRVLDCCLLVSRNVSRGRCRLAAVAVLSCTLAYAQATRPHPVPAPSAPTPVAAQTPNSSSPRTYIAPDPSLGASARLVTMNGQVSVIRDDVPWVLRVGDIILPQQVVVTGADGYAEFQVADGSHFEVFQNARLIFRNNPGDWRDLLDILIGKVKVQIEKMGGLPNPNKVRTATAVISVRGTVFDVAVEDQDDTTLVYVDEGQVEVRHLLKPGDGRLLNQGEWVRVFRNQPLTAKVIDHGAVMQRALRASMDAAYQAALNNSNASLKGIPGGGSTGAGGSGGVGDHCPSNNPNCSAPAPPPH
jgi:ferric-dicitrate binding protein FerR (iron transport regulator)